LLYTLGSNWKYQPHPGLKQLLRRHLEAHYKYYNQKLFDKTNIPLFLFLSGAGTGKSRNGTEFHQSALSCLQEQDLELRKRIEEAWVFHVSFENGSGLLPKEDNAYQGVGNRMLLQLLADGTVLDRIVRDYVQPSPWEVL